MLNADLVGSCNSPWAVPFAGDGCRRGVCPRCNKFVPSWAVPLCAGPSGGGASWIPFPNGVWPPGCLPERDLAFGIPSRGGIWPPAFPCAGRGGSRKQTVVLGTTFFVAHPVPYANKFAMVLSGHKKTDDLHHPSVCFRAENGIRTRGPQLGKLMLYQLSYFRNGVCKCKNFLEGFKGESHLFNTHCGGRVYFSYENCGEEHDEHYCCECNQVHREYCAPFKVDGYV